VRARGGLLALLGALLALPSSLAAADSFTPIRLGIKLAPVARRHAPLPISVDVAADPGPLDRASTPLRIEVKLATECGATFQTTPGTVLLNRALSPKPSAGKAYSATMRGAGRPGAFGTLTVCAYLEEQGDGDRLFANDTSNQVDVSMPCTTAANRFDSAGNALARARRALRRAQGSAARDRASALVTRRTRTLNSERRSARRACGAGVTV
jgi:hypothetical protein